MMIPLHFAHTLTFNFRSFLSTTFKQALVPVDIRGATKGDKLNISWNSLFQDSFKELPHKGSEADLAP